MMSKSRGAALALRSRCVDACLARSQALTNSASAFFSVSTSSVTLWRQRPLRSRIRFSSPTRASREALEHVGAAQSQTSVIHGLEYLKRHVLIGRADVDEDHTVLEPVSEVRQRVSLEIARKSLDDGLVSVS